MMVAALRCHRHGQAVHEALEALHGRCFRFHRADFRDILTRDEDAIHDLKAVRLLADQVERPLGAGADCGNSHNTQSRF